MTDPNKTAIAVIIDASGSMDPRKAAVIEGFNALVQSQKGLPGTCTFSLTIFADRVRTVFADQPLICVRDLNGETYTPAGGTALFDAVGQTIEHLGARLSSLAEDLRPGKVVVVIITDGEENASREFTGNRVKEMIESQTSKYSWIFNFMGCTVEAMKGAGALGISADNSVQFGGTQSRTAFANYGSKVGSVRACKSLDSHVIAAAMAYTLGDREEVK